MARGCAKSAQFPNDWGWKTAKWHGNCVCVSTLAVHTELAYIQLEKPNRICINQTNTPSEPKAESTISDKMEFAWWIKRNTGFLCITSFLIIEDFIICAAGYWYVCKVTDHCSFSRCGLTLSWPQIALWFMSKRKLIFDTQWQGPHSTNTTAAKGGNQ